MAVMYDGFSVSGGNVYPSVDLSPSGAEIERILGCSLDEDLVSFVDSITGRQAYDILCRILESECQEN